MQQNVFVCIFVARWWKCNVINLNLIGETQKKLWFIRILLFILHTYVLITFNAFTCVFPCRQNYRSKSETDKDLTCEISVTLGLIDSRGTVNMVNSFLSKNNNDSQNKLLSMMLHGWFGRLCAARTLKSPQIKIRNPFFFRLSPELIIGRQWTSENPQDGGHRALLLLLSRLRDFYVPLKFVWALCVITIGYLVFDLCMRSGHEQKADDGTLWWKPTYHSGTYARNPPGGIRVTRGHTKGRYFCIVLSII